MSYIAYRIGDIVRMKKTHPCGSKEWEIIQIGTDFRIRCCGCSRLVLIPRPKFVKAAREILSRKAAPEKIEEDT